MLGQPSSVFTRRFLDKFCTAFNSSHRLLDGLLGVAAGLFRGERQPIQVRPQAMLEARDLPRCDISDFLQDRIDKALQADAILRAKEQQIPLQQVPLPQYPRPD